MEMGGLRGEIGVLIGFNGVCGQTWHQALRFGGKKGDLGSVGGQEMEIWDLGGKKGGLGAFGGGNEGF